MKKKLAEENRTSANQGKQPLVTAAFLVLNY